jgi:branched-chain amino acid transport system substrate-binding protein
MVWLHRVLATALAVGVVGAAVAASAQERKSIRIGTSYSKTGPQAGGAAVTYSPNVQLWVHEVNAKGGLLVDGKRLPIELIEYDDRTSNEDAVRNTERLANQDKVDFILAPYTTGTNLAVAPLFARYGYPQLGVAAVTDKGIEFAKRWPNSFWLLGGPIDGSRALTQLLKQQREQGQIGNRIAMVAVADAFGIEFAAAARKDFAEAGFQIVQDSSYPLGSQDLAPVISEAKRLNPDAFVAFSYPPDTFALTEQAQVAGFNPKVFYLGVGTAFPSFKARFGGKIEGVMGPGGWNADSAGIKSYVERHKAVTGKEPDAWASSVLFASLEMLGQAIERRGLDRAAVTKELQTGTFDTVIGKVKLENNTRKDLWWVGQWQNGLFQALAPIDQPDAKASVVPKPAWPM